MRGGDLIRRDWPATSDRDGTLRKDLYSGLTGEPPTDPTADIPTTGAATYTTANVTTTSSIDGLTLFGRYSYCNEHAGTNNLVILINLPGFGTPSTMYDDTYLNRQASYIVDGKAFVSVTVSLRGRTGSTGTNDAGARESTDILDLGRAVAAAVGASLLDGSGDTFVFFGISTGPHNAGMFACIYPDRVRALIMAVPNWTLEGYWRLKTEPTRDFLRTWVGDRGQGTADDLTPYVVRDFSRALPEYMDLPGGPHLFVLYDATETETISLPEADSFVARMQETLSAKAKLHVHRTVAGDPNRCLHDDATFAGIIWHERTWVPHALRAAEWTMPESSPRDGLMMLGYLRPRTLGWEVWTGLNASPKPKVDLDATTALSGGCQHAGRLHYRSGRQFDYDPITSKNGYLQVIKDTEDRVVDLTAGTRCSVDLDQAPTITDPRDLGITLAWHSDAGIAASPVAEWVAEWGTGSLTTGAGHEPVTATDADGKTVVRFTAASQQYLMMTSNAAGLIDMNQDFVICAVVAATNNTAQRVLGIAHDLNNTGGYIEFKKSPSGGTKISWAVDSYYDSTHNALATPSGYVRDVVSPKRFVVLMRKDDVFYISIDGSPWFKTAYNETLTGFQTTPLKLVIGAIWANTLNPPDKQYYFADMDALVLALGQTAWSDAQRDAAHAYYMTRFTLADPPEK